MPLHYKITKIILLSLLVTLSHSQSEFIDRTFGDNGTLSFENDSLEGYTLLGADSLNNLYISHSELDTATNLVNYKLIKLDTKGDNVYLDRIIDQDSISDFTLKNNIIIRVRFVAGSSFIKTYDLEFTQLGYFIVPAGVINSNLMPYPDGSIQGLTSGVNNTFFSLGTDGLLDKSFGEDGLIQLDQDPSIIYNILTNVKRLKNKSLLFTGLEVDTTYNGYQPLSKLYSQDGQQLIEYEKENLILPHSIEENRRYNYVYSSLEAKDDNLLFQGFYYDTLFNPNYYITKLDIDGFTKTNFADNGFLQETSNPGDTSRIKDYCFFSGQFSNGDLLHSCYLRDDQGQVITHHLTLYNENGIKENGFGLNGKLNLDIFKGQNFPTQLLINDELYIIRNDTIQHRNSFGSVNHIENTSTYITRLSPAKLLDYEPNTPPEKPNFILFPNPITSRTLIEYNGPNIEDISLRIHDLRGQLLEEKVISTLFNYGQIPIKIADYPAGIYHLQIIDEDKEIWSTKFVSTK